MLSAVLALASAITGGGSDFLGGVTSRRVGVIPFICCAQLMSAILAAAWVAVSRATLPSADVVAAAVAAGLSLMVCLAAFFQGMVIGAMSIVAPITAVGVVIPIAAGLASGNQPSPLQVVGMGLALLGVVLVARTAGGHAPPTARAVGLALVAAAGAGLFFWLMAPASREGVPWALFIARGIPACAFFIFAVSGGADLRRVLARPNSLTTAASAILAFSSLALYAFATRRGELALVSVLASLFPAVTVVLAYRVVGERVSGSQRLGIGTVLVAVALMAT